MNQRKFIGKEMFLKNISFLHKFILVIRGDMYVYQRQGKEYKVTDKAWENVREQLVVSRVNGGFPYIVVQEGDYIKNGELYLKHSYENMELDVKYVEKVMPYIHQLWGRGSLETNNENKSVLFGYDGKNIHLKYI
ncbi:hypothetical protein CN946_07670 [Bacillus sp. AFS053548]|nr:hypothetical protein CN946_07670 [Bacillus sp. AFS053548]